jgi:lysozyme
MTYLNGTDVSYYESPVDFNKMKSSVEFTIIKVGQRDFVDRDFYRLWKDSKGLLPRGGYWFYDKRATPKSQADLWIKTMDGDFGELPLFADFEGIIYGGKDIANFKIFLEEVRKLVPEKEIIIYTGYYFWKDDSGYNSSYSEFFKQFPLWIAAYNPTAPLVPSPWTEWTFWQYSEEGAGSTYGCGGGQVDLDYFNGSKEEFYKRFDIDMEITSPPVDVGTVIKTHEGITLHKIVRHGANCWVHVIDPTVARVQISDCGYQKPSYAVKKYNAQVVTNGGGWPNKQDSNHVSNEMWVSNGVYKQNPKYIKDNRPYINISKTGVVTVSPNAEILKDMYNAVGFDRLIVINGKANPYFSDTVTPDARTASGVTPDNKLVILSVEGNDYKGRGLTFPQMAEIMVEFNCTMAGNNDGGSSTTVINTAISQEPLFIGSDGVEAPVINHIMVFTEPVDNDTEPTIPPIGDTMATKKGVAKAVTNLKSMTGVPGGALASLPIGGWVYGDLSTTGTDLINITEWYRPTGEKLTLSVKCKASVAGLIVTSVTEPPPVIPPVTTAVIRRIIDIDTTDGRIRIDGGAWE